MLRRGKKQIIWLALLAAVLLLNLPLPGVLRVRAHSRDSLAPFQNFMTLFMHKVRLMGRFVMDARLVAEERAQMLMELAALRARVRDLEDLQVENNELRERLGFAESSRHELIFCRVIGRNDTTGWWQTLRLNRGAAHGVRPMMAVVVPGGLVGKTTDVSDWTCDVLLITDPNCRVPCRTARVGAFGILRGEGVSISGKERLEMLYPAEPCRMDYIPMEKQVQQGDDVVTSGLGGGFPAGLSVGRVRRVHLDPSGLYQRAEVEPVANLRTLRYAFILAEPGETVPLEPAPEGPDGGDGE